MSELPKGVHQVKTRSGVYLYAWRGGPRLHSEPGSPKFLVEYGEAIAKRDGPQVGTIRGLSTEFQKSPDFRRLKPRTRSNYETILGQIEAELGDMTTEALAERGARGLILEWRDEIAIRSPRHADHTMSVLSRLFTWAIGREIIAVNPVQRIGRLYRADRREKIWTPALERKFLSVAPPAMALAYQLAVWTGQRQADILALRWEDYDGRSFRVKQGKSDARVSLAVARPLREILKPLWKTSGPILANRHGQHYTSDGFRTSWGKACALAKVSGVTFHDIRGTTVTRLAKAGATVPEIASITGHSLRTVEEILRTHYLGGQQELAASAIRKLETTAVKQAVKRL